MSQILDLCYRNLGGDVSAGTSPIGVRSVLDNVTPALIPLQALAAGDKRIAKEIAISVSMKYLKKFSMATSRESFFDTSDCI